MWIRCQQPEKPGKRASPKNKAMRWSKIALTGWPYDEAEPKAPKTRGKVESGTTGPKAELEQNWERKNKEPKLRTKKSLLDTPAGLQDKSQL